MIAVLGALLSPFTFTFTFTLTLTLTLTLAAVLSQSYAALPSIPDNLSPTCELALCNVLSQVLSCPALNVSGMPVICAKYLLGGGLGCPGPDFYSPVTSAPYICKSYFVDLSGGSLFSTIESPAPTLHTKLHNVMQSLENVPFTQPSNLQTTVSPLGYNNFTELCAVECFYEFLIYLNDLVYECTSSSTSLSSALDGLITVSRHLDANMELLEDSVLNVVSTLGFESSSQPHGQMLQTSSLTSSFNPTLCEFCVRNPVNDMYCMDYTSSLSSQTIPFNCYGLPASTFQDALCNTFSTFGCCFGQVVAIAQQDGNLIIPPCILDAVAGCPSNPVKSTVLCTAGSTINASVTTGVLTLRQLNTSMASILPNVFDQTSVFTLMNASAETLKTIASSLGKTVNVNAEMFTIYGYELFTASGAKVTTYTQASTVTNATYYYHFDAFIENSQSLGQLLSLLFSTPTYASMVAGELKLTGQVVSGAGKSQSTYFEAEVDPLPSSSATSASPLFASIGTVVFLTLGLCML